MKPFFKISLIACLKCKSDWFSLLYLSAIVILVLDLKPCFKTNSWNKLITGKPFICEVRSFQMGDIQAYCYSSGF